MDKLVEISITETNGRYVFDSEGEMTFEKNPNAGKEPITFEARMPEEDIHKNQDTLEKMFPTCHVNFVWEWKPGKPKNFIAGASVWAMQEEFA